MLRCNVQIQIGCFYASTIKIDNLVHTAKTKKPKTVRRQPLAKIEINWGATLSYLIKPENKSLHH